MVEFAPRSPFIGLFEAHTPAPDCGVTILDRDGLGLATLQCRKGQQSALKEKIQTDYGIRLPAGPQHAAYGNVAFVGTGPNAWLAVSEQRGNDFAAELQHKLEGCASVADQSDGYSVLRLSGPKVRETLAKGVPIDLHDKAFGPGRAASTIVSHMGVTLWRLDDDADGLAVFELTAFRSLASSLWYFLSQSAAEFGLQVMS